MKRSFILLLVLIGLGLAGCGGSPPTETVVALPTTLPTFTPAPLPTATPALSLTATLEAEPTAQEEAAAELSAPEPPEAEPDTPTPTPMTPSEETFIIPGNPDLDYAQVIFVRATQSNDGSWRFDTTVRHDDHGWDDYADAWYVIQPDTEAILGERILLHPHDNEQPFTRSQSGIIIPEELTQVIVRAKDNVEGFGGQELIVDLTVAQSDYFEVIR